MSTFVYAYGCKTPPKEVRAQIREQLWLAYRYRLMLWKLAMAGRECYRALRREHVPELVRTEEQLARMAELFELVEDRTERQSLKIELQRLRAKSKELREAAKVDAAFAADVAEAKARQATLQRALRKVFSRVLGLYSGTYLHVEAAAASANAGVEDPVRPRWGGGAFDGEGALAIQLQDGPSSVALFHEDIPSIYVQPLRNGARTKRERRTVAWYRIRSGDKGVAVRIPLEVLLHRDLPADARIKWVKLIVKRIHEFGYHYSLQFTIESAARDVRPRGHGVVAICFAGDRITCQNDRGECLVVAPFKEPSKLRELQSVRDRHRNQAIALLVGWCDRQDETADWVREEIAIIEEKRSCRRLYHLREQLRGVVDDALSRYLDEWAYRENHLYWWHNSARKNALQARKNLYRVFASNLRKRYDTVLLDSRRLADDAVPLKVERRWLALHEFRMVVKHAIGENVVSLTGVNCDEMFERWRAGKDIAIARSVESTNDSTNKRVKRTGFARKHREREETARKALDNVSE
jgi:hypothetical protein